MWVSAADVARAAVDGLGAGRAVVIPGAANRTAAALAHLAPKALILPLLAQRHPALKPERGTGSDEGSTDGLIPPGGS